MGVSIDKSRLIHEVFGFVTCLFTIVNNFYRSFRSDWQVLYIEQILSTGGGWQDQVGGVMGGANRGYSPRDLKVQVGVEKIPLSKETVAELNERILLIYTGKVRLARNLLQNVIRNWYAKDKTIIDCFHNIIEIAKDCAIGLGRGKLKHFFPLT